MYLRAGKRGLGTNEKPKQLQLGEKLKHANLEVGYIQVSPKHGRGI